LVIVLCAGCGDPMVAEVFSVMGRPGAMRLDGQLFEYEEGDDEARDDDATEPLSAIGDDGPEGVAYDLSIAGRCESRGVTKDGGAFTEALPEACDAPAGRRRTELRVDGRVIGTGTATVLPIDRPAFVVTSDVDMTYLETRFKSAPEIAALLSTPAKRHAPLAGMPELYRRLRKRADALRFISGSPTFFRRHLQARLKIDRILADEVTLKDMGAIVGANWKAPRAIEDALREQVGYKLSALLEGRLRLPPVTREVLLGDDTEMDAYAYRLYRDALTGALSAERLASSLRQLGVGDVRVGAIVDLLPRVRAWVRAPSGVILIGIRETDRPNTHHPARRVADRGMVFHRDSASLGAALAAVQAL
jgi:hypothetical protein